MNQKDPTPEQRERHLARVRRYYSKEKAEKHAARRNARKEVTKLQRELIWAMRRVGVPEESIKKFKEDYRVRDVTKLSREGETR